MKTCTKCHAELPLSEFNKNGHGRIRSECKTCDHAAQRAYRAAHREAKKIAQDAWRAVNPDYQRAWLTDHPENNALRRSVRAARTPEQKVRAKIKAAAVRANWTPEQREQVRTRMAERRATHREEDKAYAAAWLAARTPEQLRQYHLNQYGLMLAEYDAMFEEQGGLCAMGCGRPATCIDHCHDCEDIDRRGSVRGLLCRRCNSGHDVDDIDHLRKRIAYLMIHAAVCPARTAEAAA